MSLNYSLPKGWCNTELGKFIFINSGNGLTKKKMVGGKIPVFGGNGITGWHNQFNVDKRTIVIGRVGYYCGSIHLTPQHAWITDNAFITHYSEKYVSTSFLFLLLIFTNLRNYSRSTAQPVISGKKLYPINVLLPPLAEQKEIATQLDHLLAQADTLKNRLDAIPTLLKRFRQSVLAAAVSGKLTEVSGTIVKIGDIASEIRYGTSKKCTFEEGETPVLRIPNIGERGIVLDKLKFAYFNENELEKLALQAGDLLTIRSNGSVDLVGKVALVTPKAASYLFAGYLIRIRLKQDIALPNYVLYCLQSPQIREVIELQARSTSGINNINSKELAALELLLPTIEEQTKIVTRVETLFTFADKIENQIKQAQAQANKLTPSLLAKAFRGELTTQWRQQNPDLITGENSAEALLERIKAEQEKLKPKHKTRKKKT